MFAEAKVLFRKATSPLPLQKYQELLQEHPKSPDAESMLNAPYAQSLPLARLRRNVQSLSTLPLMPISHFSVITYDEVRYAKF